MHVLNLVTNDRARFYNQQIDALGRKGVSERTLPVSGVYDASNGESRSMDDYLRFYPKVLANSFGPYDLVHANYGLTAPMAVAQPNLPVVLSLWGSDLLGRYGWLTNRCARYCDAVIVMSEEMAEAVDVDCHVIPHGIDMERFRPVPQESARSELGWDLDSYHVLFPYSPERGVKNFPRAERIVATVDEAMEAPVELQWVSGVPHERMYVYMNAADSMILTSDHEGSPNAVKEALACNLPVVSVDVGDVRSRLENVEPSAVCTSDRELVDALIAVLEHGGPSNGRAEIRELSLDRMAERILDVYRSVLA